MVRETHETYRTSQGAEAGYLRHHIRAWTVRQDARGEWQFLLTRGFHSKDAWRTATMPVAYGDTLRRTATQVTLETTGRDVHPYA